MSDCAHHWKQEPGNLSAPFVCARCGKTQGMVTNYSVLAKRKREKETGQTPQGA